ncbi:MAG: hypothetical protein JOZ05_14805, partial [Acetobacteraceae bacterium]|nr:hypothetical protein [Acetobacteraceae bacterium]
MRALAFLFALIAGPAFAQTAERINGTIVAATADRLDVRTDNGTVSLTLPNNVRIGAVKDRTLDSIKQGEFVGSAAVP